MIMKIRDILKFCFKSNKKYYKQFYIFITLLVTFIFGIYTFNDSLISYLYNGIMKQYNYNYVYTNPYDSDREEVKNNLNNIKHIEEVFEPYQDALYINLEKIDNKEYNGRFILAGRNVQDLKMMSHKYSQKNDIICPSNFYYSDDLTSKKFIKKNDLIKLSNNNFESFYYKRNNDDTIAEKKIINLKVVDTFENNKYIIDENICYASRDLLSDIYYDTYPSNFFDGQVDSIIFSIDNSGSYNYVKDEVEKLKYDFSSIYFVDYSFLNFINKSTIVILTISIIFSILLIINMNKKRFYDKVEEYNILKSIGYSNKEIKNVFSFDNIINLFGDIIISFAFINIIVCLLKIITYYYPFVFEKLVLEFNFKSLFLFYILYILIFIISSKIYYCKLINSKERVL